LKRDTHIIGYYAPGSVAIFELPVYRLEEIEAAFDDAAGDVLS
jgi:hypothetical protein